MIPLGVLASAGDSPPYIDENFDVPGTLTHFTSPVAGQVPATGGATLPKKEGGVLRVPSSKLPVTFQSPLPLMTVGRKARVQVDLLYPRRETVLSLIYARSSGSNFSGLEVSFYAYYDSSARLKVESSVLDSDVTSSVPEDGFSYPYITLGADFEVLEGTPRNQMRISVDFDGEVVWEATIPMRTYPTYGDGIGLGFSPSLINNQPVYDNFKVWIS